MSASRAGGRTPGPHGVQIQVFQLFLHVAAGFGKLVGKDDGVSEIEGIELGSHETSIVFSVLLTISVNISLIASFVLLPALSDSISILNLTIGCVIAFYFDKSIYD